MWIFFSLYRVFTEKPSPKIPSEILSSFSPELDQKEISAIENRIFIEQNQIPDNLAIRVIEELPTPSPSPEATESAEAVATESAEIGENTEEEQ